MTEPDRARSPPASPSFSPSQSRPLTAATLSSPFPKTLLNPPRNEKLQVLLLYYGGRERKGRGRHTASVRSLPGVEKGKENSLSTPPSSMYESRLGVEGEV